MRNPMVRIVVQRVTRLRRLPGNPNNPAHHRRRRRCFHANETETSQRSMSAASVDFSATRDSTLQQIVVVLIRYSRPWRTLLTLFMSSFLYAWYTRYELRGTRYDAIFHHRQHQTDKITWHQISFVRSSHYFAKLMTRVLGVNVTFH